MSKYKGNHKWQGSSRKSRLPKNWDSLRRAAISRAGGRCEVVEDGARCTRRGTDVDHIKPNYLGGTDDPENLMCLCTSHHLSKSSAEGHAAKRAKRAGLKRPVEQNPPPPHPLTPPTRRGW